jgi:hypothetical protein
LSLNGLNHDAPSSPAAPLRENDIGLLAPDDDDGPLLPQVRIAGFKLTSIFIVVVVVAGAFFGLRAFIHYSTDEVTRSKTEFHDAFQR